MSPLGGDPKPPESMGLVLSSPGYSLRLGVGPSLVKGRWPRPSESFWAPGSTFPWRMASSGCRYGGELASGPASVHQALGASWPLVRAGFWKWLEVGCAACRAQSRRGQCGVCTRVPVPGSSGCCSKGTGWLVNRRSIAPYGSRAGHLRRGCQGDWALVRAPWRVADGCRPAMSLQERGEDLV